MAFEIDDFLNSAESIVVAAAKAYAPLLAFVSIGNIHEKLQADPTTYNKSEVPAIAVGAYGFVPGGRSNTIQLVAEIVSIGGDLAAVDAEAKEVLALFVVFLRNQIESRRGNLFSYQVEDVQVKSGSTTSFPMVDDKGNETGSFWAGGSVQFEVMVVN